MSELDLVIVGDVVTSESVFRNGFVGVRGEHIELVGGGTPPAAKRTRDASNCWIIPGVVDGQVHTGSQADHEGLRIGSRAAASTDSAVTPGRTAAQAASWASYSTL